MNQLTVCEGKQVVSRVGAVATAPAEASRIGARILARGGNAMDAAAAACLACAVLEPHSVDVGGYVCCAVIREAGTGKMWSLDANAIAPHRASPTMFEILHRNANRCGVNETEYDCSVRGDANVYGPLSIAVPGFVAGIGTLSEKWGRLPWREIVAESQRLLDDGFCYGATATAIALDAEMLRNFEFTWQHLVPKGVLPRADDIWHRPGLEDTLARLSRLGWQEFYRGELGCKIAGYLQSIGGILDVKDMEAYAPRITEAYTVSYRDAQVHGPVLPNGALTTLQILNLLECFPALEDDNGAAYWHRLGEIMKLAWRDRLRYLGDPDFVDAPEALLLDKNYARGRVENLRQFPDYVDHMVPPAAAPTFGTIHVSTADVEGNIVAATISQGRSFGSRVTVPGTGLILGHGISRMDPRPGLPNSIAAGKRPLNNLAPLILSLPEADVAIGTRGGRQIVNVSAQLADRIVASRQHVPAALNAPRLHVCDREPFEFLEFDFVERVSPAIVKSLIDLGHVVKRTPERIKGNGAAHCVEFLRQKCEVRASSDLGCASVGR